MVSRSMRWFQTTGTQCKHFADIITLFPPRSLRKTSSSIGTIFSPVVISPSCIICSFLYFKVVRDVLCKFLSMVSKFIFCCRSLYFMVTSKPWVVAVSLIIYDVIKTPNAYICAKKPWKNFSTDNLRHIN